MKKITLIIALFAAFTTVGCYEDKSTLADNPIDGVELSITEEEKTIRVGYQEQIDVVPNLTKGGKTDLTGLEFEWAINLIPGWTNVEYEVVGNEKELHSVLPNPVNADYYNLRLLVTDTLNDNLQYSFLYKVYVQPSMLDGLLICDTKDGQTSDLNLVMNDKFTSFYAGKQEKIFRGILSSQNATYPALVKSMAPASAGYYPGTNLMWVIDENNQIGGYETENYTLSDMNKCFIYKPKYISSVMRIGQYVCADTDMGFFAVQYVNFTSSYFGWFTASMSGYPIDNGIYAATSLSSVNSDVYGLGVWFCNEHDTFVSADMMFSAPAATVIPSGDHDLANKSAVAGGMSVDGITPTFLLKDENTGDYIIYVISRYVPEQGDYDDDWNWIPSAPATPAFIKAAYTIPAEGKALLDKAVATDFASLESILYVATADGVYTINFAGATPTVNTTAQFSAAGESITGVQLYQQGAYITEQNNVYNADDPDRGGWEQVAWNNRAVVVTAQKGEEGVVYVVPMKQFGTGNLDASAAVRYDGFGRVLAVSATVY